MLKEKSQKGMEQPKTSQVQMENLDKSEKEMQQPETSSRVQMEKSNQDGSDEQPTVRTSSLRDVRISPEESYQPSTLVTYINISLFALYGCLCRIGTEKLFGKDFANVEDTSDIINISFSSNVLGSFILGVLHSSGMESSKLRTLYQGITVGFCGSYTTWSKWNQQLNLLIVGETKTESQQQILAIFGIFIGFYSFVASYCVGVDFGQDVGLRIGNRVIRNGPKISDIIAAIVLALSVIGFAVGVALGTTNEGKQVWLATLFAPIGACIRARLSRYKIEKIKLPLGTLIANVVGSVILAGVHVINVRVVNDACEPNLVPCWLTIVSFAVGSGFCASLTTVSTVMGEIYALRPQHPKFTYFYVVLTTVMCQILSAIINGINYNVNNDNK